MVSSGHASALSVGSLKSCAGYRNANTRTAYLQQLHRWFAWCTAHQLDPLEVERTHIELYLRWFERQVGSINTVTYAIAQYVAGSEQALRVVYCFGLGRFPGLASLL